MLAMREHLPEPEQRLAERVRKSATAQDLGTVFRR
ncbi:hypothetical protein BN2475_700061 [Paraburkholderia ribeironis]|uniref:Uncharacterized protein n=1 Tax=Paraburkholderia ribeironis TaxID=1247936 RepID=A0A1N7SHW4_9BURK|nr:hypothetical protein BN2475_700061 [Paraburkholderia ribeironis]